LGFWDGPNQEDQATYFLTEFTLELSWEETFPQKYSSVKGFLKRILTGSENIGILKNHPKYYIKFSLPVSYEMLEIGIYHHLACLVIFFLFFLFFQGPDISKYFLMGFFIAKRRISAFSQEL
jgi:hypothetical protein